MKTVWIIGGTMGVGKTTTCQILKRKLDRCVFLDGDWCWDMNPFQVTEETKQMVIKNICFLLNQFIVCSAYDHIVFCWVLHEQSILDSVISGLDLSCCEVHLISLVCEKQALVVRLQKDVATGIRAAEVLARSLERMPLYSDLQTYQVDVSKMNPEQTATYIIQKFSGSQG